MAIKPVSGKIKSQEINDNLSYLDDRVSKIITTPVDGINAEEIVDAREEEESLGDRLRVIARGSELEEGVVSPITTTFLMPGKNLFNIDVVIPQTTINMDNGSMTNSNHYDCHPFISVKESTEYQLSSTGSNSNIVGYYNSGKDFISAEQVPGGTTITTPPGTRFVQLAINGRHISSFQFEEGSISTPYESFQYVFGDDVQLKPNSIDVRHASFLNVSPNLFNQNAVLNGYINSSSGDFVEDDRYYATDYIYVKPNTTYIISPVSNLRLATYSSPSLSSVISNEDLSTNIFTTPSDATFIKLHFSSQRNTHDVMLVEGSQLPGTYLPYGKYLFDESVYVSDGEVTRREKTHLADKTIVCFGDSITGGYSYPNDYPTYISERLGSTVHNVGFSGARMSVFDSGYDAFSMVGIVDAIITNDFSWQDENVDINHNYPEKLQTLKSIDFNKVDIVTIFYGTNDFNSVVPKLDNEQDEFDQTTVLGAARHAVRELQKVFPHLKIVLLSTTWRTVGEGYADDESGRFGHMMIDLVNGLKGVSELHHIPFINMYNGLGLNQYNYETYLIDGLHPNPTGRKLIADRISSQLLAKL